MKKELPLTALSTFLLFLFVVGNTFAQQIEFIPSIRVDDDTTEFPQVQCCMAAYGDSNIYIAWHDWRDYPLTGKNNLYFSNSFDGGRTWTRNLNITDNSTPDPDLPDMETDDGGNIYLVWGDEAIANIYFSLSPDSGRSWTQPVMINDVANCAYRPRLTVDDEGIIYVTWADDRGDFLFDVYFARSADCGSTWTPSVRVNDTTSGFQAFADIGFYEFTQSSKQIYICWEDSRGERDGVYFSKSLDGGKTWGENVRVSDGDWAARPRMAVGGDGVIHIVCRGRRPEGNMSIFYGKSTDTGDTWQYKMISADTFDLQHDVVIAVDRYYNIYAVWKATPELPGNERDYHIYFSMSQDGWTFSDPIRVDDSTITYGHLPDIGVVDDGRIYVSWAGYEQSRPGDSSIFFSWAQGPDWVEERGGEVLIPRFRLNQNWPNPFNSNTAISYRLSAVRPHHTTLKIYNILGEEVRSLVDQEQRTGEYEVVWDGRDSRGKEVKSGVYLCCLRVGGYVETRKLVLLR